MCCVKYSRQIAQSRQTPFSMVYGLEVVISIKMSLPTARISKYDPSNNEKSQSITLKLLDEQRDKIGYEMRHTSKSVARYHDRHVCIMTFALESLIDRKVSIS